MNINTEALIVGAGPIGLFQAFELGLLGVNCCVVEALDRPGGQCTELYPDKPIYDIPGTAYTTAADFIKQLEKQIAPFNIPIHYQQTVESLTPGAESFVATTNTGDTYNAKHVFLATGAGAFSPVKLRTEGIEQFEGTQVHYASCTQAELNGCAVVIIGDGQAAVDCVIAASTKAASILFLHRKRRLDANPQSLEHLAALTGNGTVLQIKGKITNYATEGHRLTQITVQQSAASATTHDVDHILVRQGNSPKQADFASWGIDTTAKQIPVDTANFETKLTGAYAIGDINSYPTKRKLILCGFHEATLAAFAATASLRPEKPLHLQYTTTSTELLQRLGVTEAAKG